MKATLFNLHDLVLVLVLSANVLLSVLCVTGSRFPVALRRLLAAFFILNGMIALDTLIFWGEGVKYAAFNLSPWLLTLFSFATFAIGPVFYWLVRTELSPNTSVTPAQLLHFAPAVLTPVYLYFVCYRYPTDVQQSLILDLAIYSVPEAYFSVFITLKKLSPVVYAAISLGLMTRTYLHKNSQPSNETEAAGTCDANIFNNEPVAMRTPAKFVSVKHAVPYLFYMVTAFTLVHFWILITHACGLWLPLALSDFMGILGNYINLTLLATLVVAITRKAPESASTPAEERTPQRRKDEEFSELATRIRSFVENQKPYLNPQLTLDRFAESLEIPPRQVSAVINHYFQQNFQEYINQYRIEQAKRSLSQPTASDLTILEVAHRSGFNSKATFNRIFKSQVSMTPSAYRQKQLSSNHSVPINHFNLNP